MTKLKAYGNRKGTIHYRKSNIIANPKQGLLFDYIMNTLLLHPLDPEAGKGVRIPRPEINPILKLIRQYIAPIHVGI